MGLFSIETRELRSFRLRHRIEGLRTVIENKTTDGAFCVANSLTPIEREELRNDMNKNHIVVTSLSKNMIRILFTNSKWKNVRSLLEGQIFLIRHKDQGRLSQEVLTTFLNSDKFVLRLFYQNHQIYRKEQLTRFLKAPQQHKPAALVYALLRGVLIERNIFFATNKVTLNYSK